MTSAAAWADLHLLCGDTVESGQGFNRFNKQLLELVETHRWSEWGGKKDIERRALLVYKTIGAINYADKRLAQLRAGNFDLLVYSKGNGLECPDTHCELDGLALPAGHEFWDIWAPPNCYFCSCYLTGARSLPGSVRVGGKPEKQLPFWWDNPLRGPHDDFVGFRRPSLQRIVHATLTGEII